MNGNVQSWTPCLSSLDESPAHAEVFAGCRCETLRSLVDAQERHRCLNRHSRRRVSLLVKPRGTYSVHQPLSHIAGWMVVVVVASITHAWSRPKGSVGNLGLLQGVQINFRDMMGSPNTSTTTTMSTEVVKLVLGARKGILQATTVWAGPGKVSTSEFGEMLIQCRLTFTHPYLSFKPTLFQTTLRQHQRCVAMRHLLQDEHGNPKECLCMSLR